MLYTVARDRAKTFIVCHATKLPDEYRKIPRATERSLHDDVAKKEAAMGFFFSTFCKWKIQLVLKVLNV